MTTREDDEPNRPAESTLSEQESAASQPHSKELAQTQVDEARAQELDALAEMVMKRRIAPKTLVGLGIPQQQPASEPEPEQRPAQAEAQPEIAAIPEHEVASEPQVTPVVLHAPVFQHVEPELPTSPKEFAVTAIAPAHSALAAEHSLVERPPATITPPPDPAAPAPLRLEAALDTVLYEMPQRAVPTAPRMSSVQSDAPWAVPAAEKRKEPALGSRLALIGAAFAASLVATIALVTSLLPSKKSSLLVTASGPNQVRVEQAEVYLDGTQVCTQVPCRLEGISAGTHAVNVWAKGYERMAPMPLSVRGGVESAIQLTLTRRDTAGLRVDVNVPGLSVRLDGEERGAAPTTIHQLSPTEHTLRIAGNPAYAPFEQRITLEADRVTTIAPQLLALRGTLRLSRGSGSEGARVSITRGSEEREVKLPTDIELTPGPSLHVRATRKSFDDFNADVTFNEKEPNQALVVTLTTPDATAISRVAGPAPLPIHLDETPSPSPAVVQPGAPGTLNVNSIPISNVLVDGRPVGSTPQKLTLSAGKHSLVFVHPSLGRQVLNVNVVAGQNAVAAVRF
ncbi:MAG: PEGA domain-containing protein [Polyangiaceae bacterium]